MSYSLFFKLFPLPTYLAMPAAGLDISDTSIKAIVLEEKNNLRRLVRYEEVAVPAGSVVNGEIKNAAGVIEALKLLQNSIGTTD